MQLTSKKSTIGSVKIYSKGDDLCVFQCFRLYDHTSSSLLEAAATSNDPFDLPLIF